MLRAAFITQKNEPAVQASTRYRTRSFVLSAREHVAGNAHTHFLNEEQFVYHNADLWSEFEKWAVSDSYLESWSLGTRHGGG